MSFPSKSVSRMLALGAAALLAATACSDADSDAGSSSEGPIKIMSWAPLASPKISMPQFETVAEARTAAINDAGGINGRPVELVFCDTNYDPNTEAGCARQAESEGVVAVVGPYTVFPGTYDLLDRYGIPVIGSTGINPAEFTSEMAYPLAGGIPGWYTGTVSLAKEAGAESVAMISCGSSACELASSIVQPAVSASGLTLTDVVSVATGAPDLSAPVAKAIAGKPDALILAVVPNDMPKLIQAIRNAGFEGTIASSTGLFPPATVQALGTAGDGILLTSQVKPLSDTSDPTVAQYISEMDKQDAGATKDENSEIAWGGHVLFEKLAEGTDVVNRQALTDALTNLSEPIDTGITAPYSTVGKVSPLADSPRLFNPTVYYTKIADGQVIRTSDTYVNPFDTLG